MLVANDTPSLAADTLANLRGSQTFLEVIRVDAGAVVLWSESSALRARLFSAEGAPLGDAVTLTEAGFLHNVDSDDHAGLIFWMDFLGHNVTTIVGADGSIGPNRPVTPPPISSAESARFLGVVGNRTDGKVRAFRFDAAGRPLDQNPIVIAHASFGETATTAFTRDAGFFAIALHRPLRTGEPRPAPPGTSAQIVSSEQVFPMPPTRSNAATSSSWRRRRGPDAPPREQRTRRSEGSGSRSPRAAGSRRRRAAAGRADRSRGRA